MFGECSERRMVAIGPFFVKICAFEITKIGNFAKLRNFGFFFVNFLCPPLMKVENGPKMDFFKSVYILTTTSLHQKVYLSYVISLLESF